MDPAGFAIGVAGLAGVFTSCIECFEIIQLGRHFGEDYEECVLRLTGVRLKMTRWSASIGLGDGETTLSEDQVSTTTQDEFDHAEELILHITTALNAAENQSRKFIDRHPGDDLTFGEPDALLSKKSKPLHSKMGKLISLRLKGINLGKKVKWAIYEKKKFDSMIQTVSGFVDQLVELFPAVKESQVALCKSEVIEIEETDELELLKTSVGKDDPLLSKMIELGMKNARGHSVQDFDVTGEAEAWIGDKNVKGAAGMGHNVSRFKAGEKAKVRIGNDNIH